MTINLPFLADGVEGGDVVSVLVKPGDTVTEGQALLELETDKATVPVPSPAAGKVANILVHEQDHVKVGEAIAEIEGQSSDVRRQTPDRSQSADVKRQTPESRGQPSAVGGQRAEKNQAAPVPPAPQPAPVEEAGHAKEVRRHDVEESAKRAEATVPQPAAQATTETKPSPATEARQPTTGAEPATRDTRPATEVPAAPSVRRLARELGVDLTQVQGSESGGRITAEDVKNFVRSRSQSVGAAPSPRAGPGAGAVFTTLYGHERREALPSLRRKIAANVGQAWSTIPHVHQFADADATALLALQKRHAPAFKERGANLTLTALVIKAAVRALKKFPTFNASLDLANGEVIMKEYYNIGVAVDTPGGLIVPVIHNADAKDLLTIARELHDLAERTRNRAVKLEELRGATFSISNLGGIGGAAFTPIINPPEVAILGIGRGRPAPVWSGDKFEPRTIMPLCVAYDHRLIDGADGARFSLELARAIEHFEEMMLGL